MADNKKITDLAAATTPLAGTEVAEIVQGGVNKQVPVSEFGGGGGGTVTSVTGTTNRITSTGGDTPVIDIAAAYDAAITAQIAAAQVGLWDDRGTFSAAGGAYPSSGGSGTAGAILKGDIWTISVAGTLPTGQVVEVGDTVRALIDTPGNTQANWAIQQNNIGYVPENVANKDASGGYAGLTLFKINFKNALNTFTSFFTNSNTAARTYTFQDRNGTIADNTDLALKTDQLTTFIRPTASHTLDSTDLAAINAGNDLVIEMNVASANDLTVPLNATVAFPVGTKITGIQYGVGQTSIVAAGGVTIHTSSGDFLARAQYAPFMLEKVATDEWYLSNGTTPGAVISSGTYTPSLTNTTNVAASTAYACQYLRIGASVTVSGKVSIDPTAAGDTVLGMSIPIASAFSQEFHAGGVAAAYAVAGLSAAILADATNDRFTFRFTAVDTANRDFFFSATYQII